MKILLEFDSENPEDMQLHRILLKAQDAHRALSEIRQRIFRPARKHGYKDKHLQNLIDNHNGDEVISILETEFGQILDELSLNEDGDY